jgi:hypothetical protein
MTSFKRGGSQRRVCAHGGARPNGMGKRHRQDAFGNLEVDASVGRSSVLLLRVWTIHAYKLREFSSVTHLHVA